MPSSADGEAQVALAIAQVAAQGDDGRVRHERRRCELRHAAATMRTAVLCTCLGDGRAQLGEAYVDHLDEVELEHDVGDLRGQSLEQDVLRCRGTVSATRSHTRP